MINNIDELLVQANEIEDIEVRTKFIINYFLENVQYNYAYLFAKGYAQGTISGVSNNFGLARNKTRADGDEEFSLTRSISQGESRIFNDILSLRDRNNGNYSQFIEELRSYITTELSSHLGNENIVSQSVETVIQKIEQGLREKRKVNFKGNEYDMNYDISKVLIDFLLEPKKYFPPEFDNGLITNGVCEDYTDYLVIILKKAGIEAHGIEGTSELGHAWVIIKIGDEYKSIDLTRAVFIRDGFLGIPKEQTSEDWIYSNLEDIFKMQETRSIIKIDGKELPNAINGQNYYEATFKKIMEGQDISDSTFKNLLKRGLEKGITEVETINAERTERKVNTNEREGKINE